VSTPVRPAIAPLLAEHWPEVARIYAAGILTGQATFEAQPPDWAAFDAARLADHRLVALDDDGAVLGWVAVTPVSDRCVYAGVVEHSVYVDPAAQGQGIGRLLLEALVHSTERAGVWTIQSGVFPGNTASLRLHQRVGFRVVGTRERLGRISHGPAAGQWCDVVLLERRSPVVG
jgi:L-amino acid N-acyltransferase YncA